MALPDIEQEALLWKEGSAFVFGIDEAGRGCLAGPVCAGVSCWLPFSGDLPVPVRDSKLMREEQREVAFDPIRTLSHTYGVGFASVEEIDRWNILRATYLAVARAMEMALRCLSERGVAIDGAFRAASAFISDGNHPLLSRAQFFVCSKEYVEEFPLLSAFYERPLREVCVVKGDSKVFSVACASILAKVSRDRHMHYLHEQFPNYDFLLHKGYSTPKHVAKLNVHGPCSEHRRTFAPVANALKLFS